MGRGGLVVIYDDKMLEMNKTGNAKLRALYEGGSGIVLTLGDGDFSFSAAIASQFNLRFPDGSHRLLGTSYDSQAQVMQKYPSTAGVCLDTLKRMKVPILHNIDATKLYQTLEVNKYRTIKRPDTLPIPNYVKNCSRIIFNFPNLGNLGANSTQIHQDLLRNLFIQSLPLLVRPTVKNNGERGEVHVSLRTSVFYEKWQIEEMAISIGYRLVEKNIFKTENYPGYEEQRTNPGIMRAAPPKAEGATIYRFIIDDKYIEHLESAGYMDVKPIDITNLNAYTKSIMPTEIDSNSDLSTPDDPFLSSLITPLSTISGGISGLQGNIDGILSNSKNVEQNQNNQNNKKDENNDVSKFQIKPTQIVSVKFDTSSLQKGKLPTYTPTNLPTGVMQYVPIYPHCPIPPTQEETKILTKINNFNKIDLQNDVNLKKFRPQGLFSVYHSVLSNSDVKSRNFRLGMTELRSVLDTNTPDTLKEQIKAYSNEEIVNGGLLVKVIRGTEYEKFFRAKQFAENSPPNLSNLSNSEKNTQNNGKNDNDEKTTMKNGTVIKKKAIVTKLVSVKKMINGKMITVKVPEKQAEIIENLQNLQNLQKNDKNDKKNVQKWDLPYEDRLYHALIVGVLTHETARKSTFHTDAGNKAAIASEKKAKETAKEAKDAQNTKNITNTPQGPIIRKATSQLVQQGEDDEDITRSNKKKYDPAANSVEIAPEDLEQFLGPAGSLAYELATAQASGYKLGFKEKEQIRKLKLVQDQTERTTKKLQWQAERRVKHCEEKGTEARRKDMALVTKLREEKDGKLKAKHDRKQERRIQKDLSGLVSGVTGSKDQTKSSGNNNNGDNADMSP